MSPSAATHRPAADGRGTALKFVVAAFLLWSLVLAAMTIFSANPVIVSCDQIVRADAVVIARQEGAGRDRIRIEQVLSGRLAVGDVVTALNLDDAAKLSGARSYVVPLTQFRHDWVVTTLDGQHSPPLIYAATPETVGTVREFIRNANK